MESLPMQTVCIILSLNILRGQIAKGVKISKGFRFNLNLQSILGHSMVTVNLNKSEDFVTNTTIASIEIPPFIPFFIFLFLISLILFCFTIHKKTDNSCSLEKILLFLKKTLLKYEVRSERGDFN